MIRLKIENQTQYTVYYFNELLFLYADANTKLYNANGHKQPTENHWRLAAMS